MTNLLNESLSLNLIHNTPIHSDDHFGTIKSTSPGIFLKKKKKKKRASSLVEQKKKNYIQQVQYIYIVLEFNH